MADWTNSDGLEIRFKNPEAGQLGATVETDGAVKELVYSLDLTTGNTAAADGHEAFIPAGAMIINAYYVPKVSAAGGTSVAIGLSSKDGTTTTASTAILTATLGTTANMAAGKGLVCDGTAVVPASGVTTAFSNTLDGYVYTTRTGTFTAGSGKLVVRYITKNG